jgi:hypothetical protein
MFIGIGKVEEYGLLEGSTQQLQAYRTTVHKTHGNRDGRQT